MIPKCLANDVINVTANTPEYLLVGDWEFAAASDIGGGSVLITHDLMPHTNISLEQMLKTAQRKNPDIKGIIGCIYAEWDLSMNGVTAADKPPLDLLMARFALFAASEPVLNDGIELLPDKNVWECVYLDSMDTTTCNWLG